MLRFRVQVQRHISAACVSRNFTSVPLAFSSARFGVASPSSSNLATAADGGAAHAAAIPAVFMHPLLGARDAFTIFSRHLQHAALGEKIAIDAKLVDARNHGDSPHTSVADSSGHILLDMLLDLDAFLTQHYFSRDHDSDERAHLGRCQRQRPFLIGHSMGARVGLLYSLFFPERLAGIVAIDAAPAAMQATHSHAPLMRAMQVRSGALLRADLAISLFVCQRLESGEGFWWAASDTALCGGIATHRKKRKKNPQQASKQTNK